MVFMQHGAPAHTTRVRIVGDTEWEGVQQLSPSDLKQLKSRAVREWGNIQPSVFKNLVHPMPGIQGVINMKGGYSGY